MAIFVDTSVLLIALNADDQEHERVTAVWERLIDRQEQLITSNYVVVEAISLVGRRLGLQAVRNFQANFVPVLQPVWVNENLHRRAMSVLLSTGLRHLSLVDCVSFEIMRDLNIDTAFAIDAHFQRQGFTCLP